MAFVLWIYFFFRLWIDHTVNTSQLIDIARMHCPYSDFCKTSRTFTNFTSNEKFTPCCSQCNCDALCWKLDNCCPDSNIVGAARSQLYALECTTAEFMYYDRYIYEHSRISYHKPQYRIRTTCPPNYGDHIILRKCVNSTMYMPESYDDIVVVSDASNNDIIFRNIFCAQCNGVNQMQRWNLVSKTPDLTLTKLTGADLYKFIINHCAVTSVPPDSVILTANALCSSRTISSCNATGQWDRYDKEIDKACSTIYSLYFEEEQFRTSVYQNVFCYHCNQASGTAISDAVCSVDWFNSRRAFTSLMFTALLDTSLRHDALESQHIIATGICAFNEVYDPQTSVCRQLHCPLNSSPYKGKCLTNTLDVSGIAVQFQLTFVPIKPVIINAVDTISAKSIGLDVLRTMKLMHCVKCSVFVLMNTTQHNSAERALQYLKMELIILTTHLCQLYEIDISIRETIQNKQFNLKTKQNTIPTIARFSYEYLDMYSQYPNTHFFAVCKMKARKINPVFFCPYIVLSEIEFDRFINISNFNSTMSSVANGIRSKFYNLEADKNLPQKHAICVENVLPNSFSGGCRCCILPTYLFVTGIYTVACIVLPYFF